MSVRHLLHVRSNQLVDGSPKLPDAERLEYGEIAINYSKDHETISLKNSDNIVVPLNLHETNIINNVALSGVVVNSVSATVVDHVASVTISGNNINVSSAYTQTEYPEPFDDIVTAANSHVAADDKIDAAFKKVETTVSALTQELIDDEKVVEAAVESLAIAAGTLKNDDTIEYIVEPNTNYINTATSIHDATIILDRQVKKIADDLVGAGKIDGITYNGSAVTVTDKIAELIVNPDNIPYNTTYATLRAKIEAMDRAASASGVVSTNNTILVTGGKDIDVNFDNSTITSSTEGVLAVNVSAVTNDCLKEIKVNDKTINKTTSAITLASDDVKYSSDSTVVYPTPFENLSGVEHFAATDTLTQGMIKTETTISALTQELLNDEKVTQKAVEALAVAAGTLNSDSEIVYIKKLNPNYIGDAISVSNAVDILDDVLKDVADAVSEAGKVDDVKVNGTSVVTNKVAEIIIPAIPNSDGIAHDPNSEDTTETTVGGAIRKLKGEMSAVTVNSPNKTIHVSGKAIDVNIDNKTLVSAATTGTLSVHIDGNTLSANTTDGTISTALKLNYNTTDGKIQLLDKNDNELSSFSTSALTKDRFVSAATIDESKQNIVLSFAGGANEVNIPITALTSTAIASDKQVDELAVNVIGATSADTSGERSYTLTWATPKYFDTNASIKTAVVALDTNLNTLSGKVDTIDSKYLSGITVNGVNGTVANHVASLSISGCNINVSSAYTQTVYPEPFETIIPTAETHVAANDKVDAAFKKVETTVSALTQELIDTEEVFANAITNMAKAVGNVVNPTTKQIEYIPQNAPYIINASSAANADLILATEIANFREYVETALIQRIQNAFDEMARVNNLNSILVR